MKKVLITFGLASILIVFCMLFVNPYTLTPMQLLPLVGLVYLFSSSAIYICIQIFTDGYSKNRKLFVASVLALCPAIIFALMTLGTIAAVDIVLAVVIPVLIAWYGQRIKNF